MCLEEGNWLMGIPWVYSAIKPGLVYDLVTASATSFFHRFVYMNQVNPTEQCFEKVFLIPHLCYCTLNPLICVCCFFLAITFFMNEARSLNTVCNNLWIRISIRNAKSNPDVVRYSDITPKQFWSEIYWQFSKLMPLH